MKCPKCEHRENKVIDSREVREGAAIRRRRLCLNCGHRFTTYEEVLRATLQIIKRDGRREELSRDPQELEKGVLTHFIRLTVKGMVREGISFGVAKDGQSGLRIRLVDKEVVLDLSDRAVADAILEHLQPRFRALLEGVVK